MTIMASIFKLKVLLLLGALLFCGVLCEIPSDEVLSLPGFSGSLPTRQFSGYLSPSKAPTKKMHYWFVESANDPKSDPVVLWLNGGPGCSSLESYFEELGPLNFNVSGDVLPEIPTLAVNPYAWNNIANVLFLESPVGVGFSYSTNPTVDLKMDDNQTAHDNYGVLVSFFEAYPEYKKNDFYIAGVSYGGIYVPTLVYLIMNLDGEFLNLKGFLVGNGCIGTTVGACGQGGPSLKIHLDFYHKHALISDGMYEEILAKCGNFTDIGSHCTDIINSASERIGNINIYNIYEPCINTPSGLPKVSKMRNPLKELYLSRHPGRTYFGPDECIDDHVDSKYFDNPEVRKAIHVEPVSVTGNWRVCTKKINYTRSTKTLLPIFPDMIKAYRTLIYNGDVDGCVPYVGAQRWTSGLNFTLKEPWHPWSVDNQVAGYVTEYEHDFKFVTVKGSGHLVPHYRPKQAYALFKMYIKGEKF